jgi:hypothetical protein
MISGGGREGGGGGFLPQTRGHEGCRCILPEETLAVENFYGRTTIFSPYDQVFKAQVHVN